MYEKATLFAWLGVIVLEAYESFIFVGVFWCGVSF